jgi:hypothetical protein
MCNLPFNYGPNIRPGASAGEFAPRLLSGRTRQVVLTASLCSRVEWKDPSNPQYCTGRIVVDNEGLLDQADEGCPNARTGSCQSEY